MVAVGQVVSVHARRGLFTVRSVSSDGVIATVVSHRSLEEHDYLVECMSVEKDVRPVVRCKSTGYSSQRYGACEVCDTPAAEVFIGTDDDGRNYVFGHEGCVRSEIGLATEAA